MSTASLCHDSPSESADSIVLPSGDPLLGDPPATAALPTKGRRRDTTSRRSTTVKRATAPRWEAKPRAGGAARERSPEQLKLDRETARMWATYKDTPTIEMRNCLADRYLHLVKIIADRMAAKLHVSVTTEELYSSGVFGLMDAIEKFDPSLGVRFETFCTTRVQGAMLDDLRQMDWAPRQVRACQARYDTAAAHLEAELGRAPSDIEMMEYLELTPTEFQDLAKKARASTITSLSQSAGIGDDEDQGLTRLDLVENQQSRSPFSDISQSDVLHRVLATLTPRERVIAVLLHHENLTMREIGMVQGISESRVSQIHTKMQERLKEELGAVEDLFE